MFRWKTDCDAKHCLQSLHTQALTTAFQDIKSRTRHTTVCCMLYIQKTAYKKKKKAEKKKNLSERAPEEHPRGYTALIIVAQHRVLCSSEQSKSSSIFLDNTSTAHTTYRYKTVGQLYFLNIAEKWKSAKN